jgi:hypothetical protein
MPHRILNATLENWPYCIGWFVITINWIENIPEPISKVFIAILTGIGVGCGKWLWEKVQQKFKL